MISIGIYEGEGANPQRLETCLQSFGFEVKRLRFDDLRDLEKTYIELLFLPDGWYRFDKSINRKILSWVKGGGGCVGTCAGSYLIAGEISLIPGRVLRCNFRGRLYLEPQQNHPILKDVVRPCTRHDERPHGEVVAVTQLGGPLIIPDDKTTIVASYDFEGEIGAIVAADVGTGRAVAIASHPELEISDVPSADMVDRDAHAAKNLPQGDTRLLIRNSVLWAARQHSRSCKR